MLKELEAHNLVYRSHQGLGKPNRIYVYDLLKADNDNWLPKQFKHRKGRTNEKCVDVVTVLILKYGPAIKRKWILREWIKNIQADCFWRSLACKRYQRYFDCMKAIVKNDAT